jgi:IS5 family transposase
MRLKSTLQRYFDFGWKSNLKVVQEYQRKYQKIAELMAANPELTRQAYRDWGKKLSTSRSGRRAAYSCEEILKALVVMFVEGDSYRQVVIRIESSEFLRSFVGLGTRPMMDYSFLCKAIGTLSSGTMAAMNRTLAKYAQQEEKISGKKLRMDCTVYEANIHYPTDASLLWDSYRTLARVLKAVQQERADLGLRHRYHTRKVKKLAYFIARNNKSTSRRTRGKVKQTYRTLITRVQWIAEIGERVKQRLAVARSTRCNLRSLFSVEGAQEELKRYLPTVRKIIGQAERRVLQGEKVANCEKVFSLFEPHTELLIRGKAGKAVEFGHKVLVAQNEEKFITHYQVLARSRDDAELLAPALASHRKLFGKAPEVLAADKGFYKSVQQLEELGEEMETVSIAKLGRRTRQEVKRESSEAFKEGQRFRAGSEGSISVLKRAYKMNRCLFKGFKNFATSVGCAVFCHNLVLLTRL